MSDTITDRLMTLVKQGETVDSIPEGDKWAARVSAFLRQAIGNDAAREFNILHGDSWYETHGFQLGHLEGILARQAATTSNVVGPSPTPFLAPEGTQERVAVGGRKVFVVHGHDNEVKESTARFLTKMGLEPVILHEQASGGRTIIEKFEMYSADVAFAIVLLTPDDVGGAADGGPDLKNRARQNVILELGYFMGRLGRTRVCALYKGAVELPSDYQGVIYIEMDHAGAWRAKVAQELVQSKISIELKGLLEA